MTTLSTPGCVVLLIDESAGMGAKMGDEVAGGALSTKSNAERVATALNATLKRLCDGPDFDLALVGYKADADGQVDVGSRWAGALTGREFVKVREMAAAPLRVEHRTRKVPVPGAIGLTREESVDFPVWYEPALGVKAPQVAAYKYCHELLNRWLAQADPNAAAPLLVHVFSGASADGNPQMAVERLMQLGTTAGKILLFQAHVAARAAAVTYLYPSTYVYLTVGSARDVFRRVSPLPPSLVESLKEAGVEMIAGAQGMVYNAKMVDLIRFLGLMSAYTRDWMEELVVEAPAAEPAPVPAAVLEPLRAAEEPSLAELPGPLEAPPAELPSLTEKAALAVLVLDRSVADPFTSGTQNPCTKLQDHANELLAEIARLDVGEVDAAMVSYGDAFGQLEIRSTFAGPLEGRTLVPHTELVQGALRVEEITEEMSNGMGGLIAVKRKKPVFFDLEPTAAAPPEEAFKAAAGIVAEWCGQHPSACVPPIVLHLTRGQCDPADMERAAARFETIQPAAGPVLVYHLVATQSPHKSVAYPQSDADLAEPALQALFRLSGPLLRREQLAEEKRTCKAQSVGMVVNGKFDLLVDALKGALA